MTTGGTGTTSPQGGSAGSPPTGGASASPIGGSRSSGGIANQSTGGSSIKIDECPPCVAPPHPSCRGLGTCGCGPYECPTPAGPAGEALEAADCRGPVQTDGEHVYYTLGGMLYRITVGATYPERLAQEPPNPNALFVDASGIYTAHYGGVTWSDKNGGSIRTIVGVSEAVRVAVAGGFAFYTVVNQGDVYRVALDAKTASGERIAEHSPHALAMAVDETHVYWAAAKELLRVPVGGGTTEMLADNARGDAVALDSKYVYWTSDDGVQAMPKSGGARVPLVQVPVQGITTDGAHLYWTQGAQVSRTPSAGGPAEVVAGEGFEASAALAVDAKYVYWLSCQGPSSAQATLRRIAK
ncbi:MAG TPA: hypothetical protein VFQ61_00590 [Polyangiaceae bacterium]|nr:hypothetical protein [Polyangiaceae bacterium]